jgi:hypothetical protein
MAAKKATALMTMTPAQLDAAVAGRLPATIEHVIAILIKIGDGAAAKICKL